MRAPLTSTVTRKMKYRVAILTLSALLLPGCSFLVDLALFNNSADSIEVCNLNLNEPACQTIMPRALEKVLMVGDKPATSWRFSVRIEGEMKIYEIPSGRYSELASDVYCEGIFQKRCDIPVQYEPDGRLYWGGKSNRLPVVNIPEQPNGFPIEPSA